MYNKGINTHLRYRLFTKNIGYHTSSSTLLKCPPLVNTFNVIQKNDYTKFHLIPNFLFVVTLKVLNMFHMIMIYLNNFNLLLNKRTYISCQIKTVILKFFFIFSDV